MNLYSLSNTFYNLCKVAGILKCPEKTKNDIVDFALANYARHSLDYLQTMEKKLQEEIQSNRILAALSKDNSEYIKRSKFLTRELSVIKNIIGVVSKDIKSDLVSPNYQFKNLPDKIDPNDIMSQILLRGGYQIASKEFKLDLSDLPKNYPIGRMLEAKDSIKFVLMFSPRKVFGAFNQAFFDIKIYTNKNDLISVSSYLEHKKEIEITIGHELLHMVQSLLNVALGYSYVDKNISNIDYLATEGYPIEDKGQSNIFRHLSPASQAFQKQKLKQQDLRYESGFEQIQELKKILGISPRKMITTDMLRNLKDKFLQSEIKDSKKIEALDDLIDLMSDASYYLSEREFHTHLSDSYENFSRFLRLQKKQFSKENFNEWVGNPNVTVNTDEFFSLLRRFDLPRWKEAVKQLWKLVEPAIAKGSAVT